MVRIVLGIIQDDFFILQDLKSLDTTYAFVQQEHRFPRFPLRALSLLFPEFLLYFLNL